jgi:hypothetical protein
MADSQISSVQSFNRLQLQDFTCTSALDGQYTGGDWEPTWPSARQAIMLRAPNLSAQEIYGKATWKQPASDR